MDKKGIYREQFESQLKDWKAKIEMLEDKAAKATGETKTELTKAIRELRKEKESVKVTLNKLEKESGVALQTMRAGVEKSAAELKTALDKIVSRFK